MFHGRCCMVAHSTHLPAKGCALKILFTKYFFCIEYYNTTKVLFVPVKVNLCRVTRACDSDSAREAATEVYSYTRTSAAARSFNHARDDSLPFLAITV